MVNLCPNPVVSVIDDDVGTCKSIALLIRCMNVVISTFKTAEEFLECSRQDQPGCIVSDLRMPGMSGLALLERLRSNGVSTPLILISAFADVPLAVEALKNGALTVLEKPFRPQQLWDCIALGLKEDHERRASQARRAQILERVGNLNEEESRILEMLIRDVPYRVIAKRMQISPRTVDLRRAQILAKLQMENLKTLIWHLGAAGWQTATGG